MYNLIFLYYGLLAMLTQLVVFRELSVLFYGSELFLGTFLSSWLFWTGSGSLFVRRLLKKECPPLKYFSYSFLVFSLLLPAVILLIRLSKSLFPFGEFIGPVGTILFTFTMMSFLCFITGSQFSLACAVAVEKVKKEAALGRVYLCESLGAVIGGALFTYILIGHMPTFIIAIALSLGSVFISLATPGKKMSIKSASLGAAALIILLVIFKVEPAANRIEWKKYQFILQKEARNATFSLAKMGSIKNIFVDGVLSASFPAPENYEPVAHWPLLATADPGQILIVGDSSLGVLNEALKHNPKSVDYVLSDGSFIDLAGPYLESEYISALKDPRVHIYYNDPRIFIKKSKNRYDDVIVNIPEVPNLKLNRFYTEEFYSRIRSILKPAGILALSVISSENYLSAQTRIFNASVYHTLKSVFRTIEIIPGDNIIFLSSPSLIDMRRQALLKRFNDRRIYNHYVIPSYIEYKLGLGRRAELKKILEDTRGAQIDRDFKPVAYYYFAGLWLNKFASPLGYIAEALLLIFIILFIITKRRLLISLARKRENVLIFILGFMGILLEVVLLLAFQIISGYVYWQLGILFASFMFGLFLGAASADRFKYAPREKHFALLVAVSLSLIVFSVCAGYFLPRLADLSTVDNMLIFPALLAFVGTAVGASFVLAGFLVPGDEIMIRSGRLYAADLWGAALGAILSTNFIVPICGILGTLNFSAVMGIIGLAIFLILSKGAGR